MCIDGAAVNVCEDSTPLYEHVQFAMVSVQFWLKAVEFITVLCEQRSSMLSYLYASCIFPSASPTNSLLSLLPLNKKKKTTHRTVYNRIWDETHNQSR